MEVEIFSVYCVNQEVVIISALREMLVQLFIIYILSFFYYLHLVHIANYYNECTRIIKAEVHKNLKSKTKISLDLC